MQKPGELFSWRSRICRRGFIGGTSALGVASLADALLPDIALAAEPKSGGHARFGLATGSESDSLDPATFQSSFMIFMGYCLRNHLTEIDQNNQLIGELAESWEASDDATVWTFKLRQGIEFHNGKTLDSNDVVASINHHRGETSKTKGIIEPVSDVQADGPDTVVFTLTGGMADFPYLVNVYHLAIMPADGEGNVDWRSGVGTGGYVMERFEPGALAGLKRFGSYWKEGRAHFDQVSVISIPNSASRAAMLMDGEIDAIERVNPKQTLVLERNADLRVEETASTRHSTFPMRTDTPPFDNNNVRLALKFALDREVLLQAILGGRGYLGNDHPIGRPNRFFASELPQRQFDPDKAKFHLKQVGLSDLKVSLHVADAAFDGAVDAAVFYKEHASKADITIEVVREPNDGYWSNVYMHRPWTASQWPGELIADWMFSIAYASNAPWNETFWQNERFDRLLVESRGEMDEQKRYEMYVEMQEIVRDEGGSVIPMFNNHVSAVQDRVQHGELAGNEDLDGYKASERWWFVL